MYVCDAVIVGEGPAGSTCARRLRLAGWNVVLLDRARFPRDKVCGGWLTPDVFRLLDLVPQEYRATGLTLQEITGFRTSIIGGRCIATRYPDVVSYAIRRCEFDDYLLRRAHVRVIDGTPLMSLRRRGDAWIVNDEVETPVVVGAGGHFCPVGRHLQGGRDHAAPVIAKEAEFRLDGRPTSVASDTPELFFSRDLEGYGWCVRKNDYLNIGIGRRAHGAFAHHLGGFIAFLTATGRVPDAPSLVWRGHAYHAGARESARSSALVRSWWAMLPASHIPRAAKGFGRRWNRAGLPRRRSSPPTAAIVTTTFFHTRSPCARGIVRPGGCLLRFAPPPHRSAACCCVRQYSPAAWSWISGFCESRDAGSKRTRPTRGRLGPA